MSVVDRRGMLVPRGGEYGYVPSVGVEGHVSKIKTFILLPWVVRIVLVISYF